MNWKEFIQNKPKKSGYYAIIYGKVEKQLAIGFYCKTTKEFLYPIDQICCAEYKNVTYWRSIEDFPCKDELIQGFKK